MSPWCFNIYEMKKGKKIDENHHKYFDGGYRKQQYTPLRQAS